MNKMLRNFQINLSLNPFALRLTALLGFYCLSLSSTRAEAPELTPAQLRSLNQALAPLHQQYNPEQQMIRRPFSSPGYHTTLKGGLVHPTRDSLNYAVALLDTGDEELRKRAISILRRVIALQDQSPESRTYGIWSWFLEEPLEQMSPPDWNWADFCGAALLQVALHHRDQLPPDLAEDLDAAIQHAARSIQRRNVGPGYTNIAIMGTYVTLIAAQLYDLADLRKYAMDRLQRFHDYTLHHGAFTEYNSPTYTTVALKELGRLRRDAKDPDALRWIEEIYRLAWEEIAHHFHPPTRQWTGPHSRCYSTFLRDNVLTLIQQATNSRIDFGVETPSLDSHRLSLPCPSDLQHFFVELPEPRSVVKTFVKAEPPLTGTSYIAPEFTLGTINRGDLWNQRRSLVAYWGDAKNPSYLHLRFLHDGYDFAAAQFFSVQHAGDVLAGINFALDGGDTHISLDRIKNATIQAKDLRLRFEFGGQASLIPLSAPKDLHAPVRLASQNIQLNLAIPYVAFGDEDLHWESGRDEDRAWLDLVIYSGPEKPVDFRALKKAVIGIALAIGPESSLPAIETQTDEGMLQLSTEELKLILPIQPAKAVELRKKFKTSKSSGLSGRH